MTHACLSYVTNYAEPTICYLNTISIREPKPFLRLNVRNENHPQKRNRIHIVVRRETGAIEKLYGAFSCHVRGRNYGLAPSYRQLDGVDAPGSVNHSRPRI